MKYFKIAYKFITDKQFRFWFHYLFNYLKNGLKNDDKNKPGAENFISKYYNDIFKSN